MIVHITRPILVRRWIHPAAAAFLPATAEAHCDGLDGPVVTAARTELESRNLDAIVIWVQRGDEAELRNAFARALAVRAAGGDAQALAATWFFETAVRLHRAGEGEPFTGLKPAGRDLGPAIPAADRAWRPAGPTRRSTC